MTSLTHKRILVTRPRAQAAELCQRLAALGAQPIRFPTIEIAPPENYTALDKALAALADYDWLIFTSVNGVEMVRCRLEFLGRDTGALRDRRLAAIGPATAEALRGMVMRPLM